ncbi:MAG: hypothetical protein H7Y03_02305 [Chitinophagaceae bacterium]|nr:hypothetical protein [Chitinophagaceae bacterium]
MKRIILLLPNLLLGIGLFCQTNLSSFNKDRLHINRNGMTVLASWAAANIISGAIGQSTTEGETKYFHRMNLVFGSVNLALSGVALFSLNRKGKELSFAETMKEQSGAEKIFLFNAGFDLAYIVGGVYLIEKGNNDADPSRYRGYGKSLLMQGAALFVFDGIMYLLHNNHGKILRQVLNTIEVSGNSLGLKLAL